MSTRSHIGIENSDGTVTYVYCHWDGYPTGVGAEIVDLNRLKARQLIAGGDMSTPGEYYKARGEDWEHVKPKTAKSVAAYLQEANEDYTYLINRHGTWKFRSYGSRTLHSLVMELKSGRDRG